MKQKDTRVELTEERVREIVREEIMKLKGFTVDESKFPSFITHRAQGEESLDGED